MIPPKPSGRVGSQPTRNDSHAQTRGSRTHPTGSGGPGALRATEGPDLGPGARVLSTLEREGVFRAIDLMQEGWREFAPDGEQLVVAGDGIEVTTDEVRLKFDTQITIAIPRDELRLGGVLRKETENGSQETQAQQ